jgi:hypothetical protein
MYYTLYPRTDGFCAQFQSIIHLIYYSAINNGEYIHTPIDSMEHNYSNDNKYIYNIENIMNIKIFKQINAVNKNDITVVLSGIPRNIFEVDVNKSMMHPSILSYKKAFLENINNNYTTLKYNNNMFNIAIHIRRGDVSYSYNSCRYTSNEYYLNIINKLRKEYCDKHICFHIYSEGNESEFYCFKNIDTILHINEDVIKTFIGLIDSDVLVQSISSFSYVAGLLSYGIVYHIPFWHPPLSNWIICNTNFGK